jgi:hypothetical protein
VGQNNRRLQKHARPLHRRRVPAPEHGEAGPRRVLVIQAAEPQPRAQRHAAGQLSIGSTARSRHEQGPRSAGAEDAKANGVVHKGVFYAGGAR